MKKITALISTAAICLLSVPFASVSAANKIPSWIPQSPEEAAEFYKQYGSTHIGEGFNGEDVACIVFKYGTDYNFSSTKNDFIYHETFKDSNGYDYEVAAFSEMSKSPVSFEITFSNNSDSRTYTFEADGSCNLTETDDYSWMPDCYPEYCEFISEYGELSVMNGYIVFCDSRVASLRKNWAFSQTGEGNIKISAQIACNPGEYVPYMTEYYFNVYKPVESGIVNLKWKLQQPGISFPADTIERTYYISDDFSEITEQNNISYLSELQTDEERVILTDYETGILISDKILFSGPLASMTAYTGRISSDSDGEMKITKHEYLMSRNPLYLEKSATNELLDVSLEHIPVGYYLPADGTEIRKNENGSVEIVFRLKTMKNGDINNDGEFGIADVVTLQEWLLAAPDAKLSDWKAADLCEDGELNAFDLCMMKQKLVSQTESFTE